MDENEVEKMAVLTIEEFMSSVTSYIGENTDDASLKLLEDMNDTLKSGDGTDWKKKYEDNDKAWRQKYKSRFNNIEDDKPQDEPDRSNIRIADLFSIK